MKIRQLIETDHVHLELQGRDLLQALEAVAEVMSTQTGLDKEAVVEALLERERLGSTSVGEGFAIPHCKISGLKDLAVSLTRFATPVDFGASDDEPVSFFFVVLSPPDQPAAHLQVLSQIARVLKRTELRRELLTASDPEHVVDAIRRAAEAEGL